jgi:hypothetical protein
MRRYLRLVTAAATLGVAGAVATSGVSHATVPRASASWSVQAIRPVSTGGSSTVAIGPPSILCSAVIENHNTSTSAQQSTYADGYVTCTSQEDQIVWTWTWTDLLTGQVLDSASTTSYSVSMITTRTFEDKSTAGLRKVTFCYTAYKAGLDDGGNHCSDTLSGL